MASLQPRSNIERLDLDRPIHDDHATLAAYGGLEETEPKPGRLAVWAGTQHSVRSCMAAQETDKP